MCGFLFVSSKEIIKYSDNLAFNDASLKKRGPDAKSVYERGRFLFVHYLLSITGNYAFQPKVEGERVAMFNGEIYNYKEFYEDEIQAIATVKLTEECIMERLSLINGEYAGLLFDDNEGVVLAFTDHFGTKPLWIGYSNENEDWGLCSYPDVMIKLGLTKVARLKPATAYLFNNMNGSILKKIAHSQFSLRQYKENYDDWFAAFEQSIHHRTDSQHQIIVPLSSGYDSGCIAAACSRLSKKVNYATIKAEEDQNIMELRSRILGTSLLEIIPSEIDREHHGNMLKRYTPDLRYNKYIPHASNLMSEDPGAMGLSIICDYARRELDARILLSGQGADEVYSDYGFKGIKFSRSSHLAGLFPEDLNNVFPWPNFYSGVNKCYLLKDEYVTGAHSIEGRYPFLDRLLVQEFIWLKNDLKNNRYKAPLAEYLDEFDFPFKENEKRGFNAFAGIPQ